jgi:hypothetical protein
LATAGITAAILVVALVVWLVARGHSSPARTSKTGATAHSSTMANGKTTTNGKAMANGSTMTHSTPAPSTATPHNAILAALTRADQDSVGAKGLLPPSACTVLSGSMVRCANPHYAVSSVTFETFHSLGGLYASYVHQARMLSGGKFKANFNDCTQGNPNGEVSWNHDYKHPRVYSVAQLASGHLSENDAAGRVFCTFADGDYVVLWTQNAGHVLAQLSGNPHGDAWVWWKHVHHEIALGGGAMPMTMGG